MIERLTLRNVEALRSELGFWPSHEPHELTAKNDDAKLSAKRVAKVLALERGSELVCHEARTRSREPR